ncbi:MAG: hypothetical protein GY796_09790 [Chloroflexi bacterium]|nr:hypothetical protein [Chloroflexota bacterium]
MKETYLRLLIMILVVLSLLAALWAGLLRIGWGWPALQPLLPSLHGPLMVSGFLGTLIGLERAVALGPRKFYMGPLLSGVGGLWLIIGLPIIVGQALIVLGSVGLTAVSLHIIRQHKTNYTVVMGLGALCWLMGNGLWLAGWPIFHFVYWWAGFLILTIVGERLELSRVQRLSPGSIRLFDAAVLIFLAGLLLSLIWLAIGNRLASLGVVALAIWLLRYDIARRTVRQSGLTRYIGANLLVGYGWLVVGGLAALSWGALSAGPYYDLWLHAIFLGFAFGMIFAHALIILPSVTGMQLPYRPIFYLPSVLLHVSLLLRVLGDVLGLGLRPWGGLLNAVAILLFFGLVIGSIVVRRLTADS